MDAVVYRLGGAAEARRAQMDAAKSEFERAVQRAAATAAQRSRAIERQWVMSRGQARKVAGVRRGLWREHQGLDSGELRTRLAVHEFQLSEIFVRTQHPSDAQLAAHRWYARMIRSELRRRGIVPRALAS